MVDSLSDATLLERFVSDREEAAFVALVRRHGPRVERICRRILRNDHDVEDVFQATFLVLARKAAGIPWRESISFWIDSVARRLALHARSGVARQSGRERSVTSLAVALVDRDGRLPERFHPMVEPSGEVEWRDLRRVLDDELDRLPEKYRAPVVLCDLEGHTREEAARRLGWPAGSMSRRLDRARSLLRQRLTHRGVALSLIGLASMAVAAAAIGWGMGRPPDATSVRQVMASFRSVEEGGRDYGVILAAAARLEGRQPDYTRILPAAREATAVARRLEGRASGPRAGLWDQIVRDMKQSAADMERACRDSDAPALIAAARRLDASCLNCHAAFAGRPSAVVFSLQFSVFSQDPPEIRAGRRESVEAPAPAVALVGCSPSTEAPAPVVVLVGCSPSTEPPAEAPPRCSQSTLRRRQPRFLVVQAATPAGPALDEHPAVVAQWG